MLGAGSSLHRSILLPYYKKKGSISGNNINISTFYAIIFTLLPETVTLLRHSERLSIKALRFSEIISMFYSEASKAAGLERILVNWHASH